MAESEFPDLWRGWRARRDAPSREALLEAYLPLVQRIFSRLRVGLASQVAQQAEDDLKNAGVVGLIEAFERYSPGREASFSTYAGHRIRGAMLDELRSRDWLSKGCRRRLKEIQRASQQAEQKLGRAAGEEEVARVLGLSLERYRQELVEVGPATLFFLEDLTGPGGEARLPAGAASGENPEEAALAGDLRQALARQIDRLPEKERLVLALLVHDELGQKEIAKVLNVSPSRVSQIYAQAIVRLRAALLPAAP